MLLTLYTPLSERGQTGAKGVPLIIKRVWVGFLFSMRYNYKIIIIL